MNAKPKSLRLFVTVCLCAAATVLFFVRAFEVKGEPLQPIRVYHLPPGTLELREKQLLARKHAGGWQLCRLKRFVLQDCLEVLQSQGKVDTLIREVDASDSQPIGNPDVFVVLEVATPMFSKVEEVKANENLLKSMEGSDEILVKAADVKPPNFSLVK